MTTPQELAALDQLLSAPPRAAAPAAIAAPDDAPAQPATRAADAPATPPAAPDAAGLDSRITALEAETARLRAAVEAANGQLSAAATTIATLQARVGELYGDVSGATWFRASVAGEVADAPLASAAPSPLDDFLSR